MKIGIDEVGRGPIAGPVTVCAFATELSDEELLALFPKKELKDSKKLTAKNRALIFEVLQILQSEGKVFWHVSSRTAKEIDQRGISICIKECIQESLEMICKALLRKEESLLVYLDGSLHAPTRFIRQETIIKGDENIPVIACASIVAKETRDIFMKELAKDYPAYGFEKHVGYGTRAHYEAIKSHGLTPLHRKSFLKKLQ